MTNFCPKCGYKINQGDVFCQNCGFSLTGSAVGQKEQLTPEKAPLPVNTPKKYIIRDVIKACIQIIILGLFLYWVWHSYGCAVGKYIGNGDQMCGQIYQFFQGGGGGNENGGNGGNNQVGIGCQHCSSGYCWTENHCCPSSSQYYCNGYCYRSSNDAYNAGCHQSSWTRFCCP